jgi:propanol-preferring alcohol dehydrogenase
MVLSRGEMKMSKMMRAAVVESLGKPLVLQEVPVPEPGRGEILVSIEANGPNCRL